MTSAAARAERKVALVAASARLRADIAAQLAPLEGLEARAAGMKARVAAVAGRPVAIAAIVAVVVVVGPRRLLGLVRWALVTVPMYPMGRRLASVVARRLFGAMTGTAAGPAGR